MTLDLLLSINCDSHGLLGGVAVFPRSSVRELDVTWKASDVVLLGLWSLESPDSLASATNEGILWEIEFVSNLLDSDSTVFGINFPSVSSGWIFVCSDHNLRVSRSLISSNSILKFVEVDLKSCVLRSQNLWFLVKVEQRKSSDNILLDVERWEDLNVASHFLG